MTIFLKKLEEKEPGRLPLSVLTRYIHDTTRASAESGFGQHRCKLRHLINLHTREDLIAYTI